MYIDTYYKIIIPKGFKVAGSSLYTYLRNNVVGDRYQDVILYNNHNTFSEIINEFGFEIDDYREVKIIRNPWDYVVSAYEWSRYNREIPENMDFSDFVFKDSKFNWKKQIAYWSKFRDNDICVEFEDIPFSLIKIFDEIEHDFKIKEFPHKKKIGRDHYRNYYSSSYQVNYIKKYFSKLLEYHKYTF